MNSLKKAGIPMFVKNRMRKAVITPDVNDAMAGASGLIQDRRFKRRPVVKRGKLPGTVTGRDPSGAWTFGWGGKNEWTRIEIQTGISPRPR
ncbi:MAG: hypothetical protein R6X27_04200 [Candidatus Desulfacyla sp.]